MITSPGSTNVRGDPSSCSKLPDEIGDLALQIVRLAAQITGEPHLPAIVGIDTRNGSAAVILRFLEGFKYVLAARILFVNSADHMVQPNITVAF